MLFLGFINVYYDCQDLCQYSTRRNKQTFLTFKSCISMDVAIKSSKRYLKGSHNTPVVTNFLYIYMKIYICMFVYIFHFVCIDILLACMYVCTVCLVPRRLEGGTGFIGTKVKEHHKCHVSAKY